MIFVGIDWAEAHHEVCVVDADGRVLGRARVTDGLDGVARLDAMVANHADGPDEVVVGIETDRGLLVRSLIAAGYHVFAINPLQASRYRDRHAVSGAKSDRGDAKVLADLVRTDRHNHREVAGDSPLAEALKVLARAHQSVIWARQRQANSLRHILRQFYPGALACFGTDLSSVDALTVLALAPTPEQGRALSVPRIASALKKAGRRRAVEERARRICAVLRTPQLAAPVVVAEAYAATVRSAVQILLTMNAQIEALERELEVRLGVHPDAEVLRSLPGLGTVLGARVLGEFGDDRTRYADPRSRKCYAGTAPITRASGRGRVVLARVARNRHLADACYVWAFCSLTRSPGARRCYELQRSRGKSHAQALRSLANRLVGILHGCLARAECYREEVAWPSVAAAA